MSFLSLVAASVASCLAAWMDIAATSCSREQPIGVIMSIGVSFVFGESQS